MAPSSSSAIAAPAYDRSALTPGIVHIGVGNFHRAHMAVYLDDLFAMGEDHDWAILGAGVRAPDAKMRAALKAQDHGWTVIELDPKGKRARRVGAMIGFIQVEEDNAALVEAMSRPEIRIVSLTVTEGGYFIESSTGAFDAHAPEIIADAASPERPGTAFGAILKALRTRREAGVAPFTVMSCDNLPGNGDVARAAVTGLAKLSDPDFAQWVDENVAFPNGMVDRIAPATGPKERALAGEMGAPDDAAPVTCEPFRQWVLEDRFPMGRPALEKVGVTFTDQVHAFELMKLRILNGGHAIIAYPGALMGIEHVHEAMANDAIRGFLDKTLSDEVLPITPPVPGQDLNDYKSLIIERFSNPEIADTEHRLCFDGSNRQPKFIIPSIIDNLARGVIPQGLALECALWRRYCAGVDEAGNAIAPNDPDWEILHATAKQAPEAWLEMRAIYGDLGENAGFREAFVSAANALERDGVEATLKNYIAL